VRRLAVAATATAALALAPPAFGHGSVRPTAATPGGSQVFTFVVLNGRDVGIVAFQLQLPAGATVEDATWVVTSTKTSVEWRGGPIPARTFDSFQVRVKLPDRQGTVSFLGTEVFDDGAGPPSRFDVVLAGGAAPTAGEVTDDGARTLGTAALVVAIAALLVAAVALVVSVVRRRGAPPSS
jgi:uncharacterized protein YcnI